MLETGRFFSEDDTVQRAFACLAFERPEPAPLNRQSREDALAVGPGRRMIELV
jgi:hypothetical protein